MRTDLWSSKKVFTPDTLASTRNRLIRGFVVLLAYALLGAAEGHFSLSHADDSSIDWTRGPTVGELGPVGQISVPKGYSFAGKDGAQKVLQSAQNPVTGDELGVLVPNKPDNKEFFYVIFSFHDIGYVRDDDGNQIDADTILKTIREGTEAQNEKRKDKGWAPIHVVGWYQKPYYNNHTNNLTWSILGETEGESGKVVNYFARSLGRRGTMSVDLIISEGAAAQVLPEFNSLLAGFSYDEGQKYAEFRTGDKIAEYCLTALIAGGAGALIVKSGLLAKLWKFIALGVVALLGMLRRFFERIKQMFRRKEIIIQSPIKPDDHS
jgi:uncharacterized membrane-anchored protein